MTAQSSVPRSVNAAKALTGAQHYAGAIAVAQLPRLKAAAQGDGALDVELRAERDKQGAWLRGEIRGKLALTCQRGLHPFDWECRLPVELRLVSSEAEEAKLLKEFEPYRVQDDKLPLYELVEEEVLLALPMMPRCDDPGCAVLGASAGGDKVSR